jgi:uncharacterized protein (TIGR03085 family)
MTDADTTAPTLARAERAALCDLFDEVGPDAPTLCAGWTTRDLAAHLVIRERRADASMGIVAKPLAGWTERVQAGEAKRPWAELVHRVRDGAPWYSAFSIGKVDEMANGAEYFIHHEDVRRAAEGWEPRVMREQDERFLWAVVSKRGSTFFKAATVGVTLRTPEGREAVAKPAEPERTVVITGPPSELAMFAFGRKEHARVEFSGEQGAIDELLGTSLGI